VSQQQQQQQQQHDNSSSPAESRSLQRLSLENCDDTFRFLEDFGVLVYKQHHTGVVNLNKHLLEHHATPAALRREIVGRFIHFSRTEPKAPRARSSPIKVIVQSCDALKSGGGISLPESLIDGSGTRPARAGAQSTCGTQSSSATTVHLYACKTCLCRVDSGIR
jgi:hypothetical protein